MTGITIKEAIKEVFTDVWKKYYESREFEYYLSKNLNFPYECMAFRYDGIDYKEILKMEVANGFEFKEEWNEGKFGLLLYKGKEGEKFEERQRVNFGIWILIDIDGKVKIYSNDAFEDVFI